MIVLQQLDLNSTIFEIYNLIAKQEKLISNKKGHFLNLQILDKDNCLLEDWVVRSI